MQAALCSALQGGAHLETAAGFAGINKSTLHRWLEKGRAKQGRRYRRLLVAVERALAHAEMRDVLRISKAGEKDWRAAAWRLERRFPERWGKRSQEQASPQMTPEESAAKIREFLAAAEACELGLPVPESKEDPCH